ncbi:MAG: hypothetical protein ACYC6A_00660 [Armatimonadota bacterium]
MLVPSDENGGKVATEQAVNTPATAAAWAAEELPVTRTCGRLLCEAGQWYLRHHALTPEKRAAMLAALDAATACPVKGHYCLVPASALSVLHQAGSGYLASLQVVGWRKTYLRAAMDESAEVLRGHAADDPGARPGCSGGLALSVLGGVLLFLALVYAGPVVLLLLR